MNPLPHARQRNKWQREKGRERQEMGKKRTREEDAKAEDAPEEKRHHADTPAEFECWVCHESTPEELQASCKTVGCLALVCASCVLGRRCRDWANQPMCNRCKRSSPRWFRFSQRGGRLVDFLTEKVACNLTGYKFMRCVMDSDGSLRRQEALDTLHAGWSFLEAAMPEDTTDETRKEMRAMLVKEACAMHQRCVLHTGSLRDIRAAMSRGDWDVASVLARGGIGTFITADDLLILSRLVRELGDAGMQEEAVALGRGCLERHERALGKDDRDTLGFRETFRSLLAKAGDHEGAVRVGRESLDAHRRMFGEHSEATISVMQGLALGLAHVGKHDEALDLLHASLEEERLARDKKTPETVATMATVAQLLVEAEMDPEAVELWKKCLKRARRAFGNEDEKTISIMLSLAKALYRTLKREKIEQALALAREAWEARKRALGKDHEDTDEAVYVVASCSVALKGENME